MNPSHELPRAASASRALVLTAANNGGHKSPPAPLLLNGKEARTLFVARAVAPAYARINR